jgi:hypothetical protein
MFAILRGANGRRHEVDFGQALTMLQGWGAVRGGITLSA